MNASSVSPSTGRSLPPISTDVAAAEANASGAPRVWFLTDGLSPIAVALSKTLLRRGDYVVSTILPEDYKGPRGDGLRNLMTEMNNEQESGNREIHDDEEEDDEDSSPIETIEKGWKERFKLVPMDARRVGQTQSTIAEAVELFGHIDVLLVCRSEALVGTIEELSQTARARSLVRDQFETNLFAPVNVIKAVLPVMREKKSGHIIVITGITAHLGTPGLGMYCASQWAIEGYCDSLAYEVAPFNIKLTIVQPNLEVGVLTNKITTVPRLQDYSPRSNRAPLAREILNRILKDLPPGIPAKDTISPSGVTSIYPQLPEKMQLLLTAEIVHSLASIGSRENPPARLIVGFEGISTVKEKLKTVSEELEDFIEVSEQVDLPRDGDEDEDGEQSDVHEDT